MTTASAYSGTASPRLVPGFSPQCRIDGLAQTLLVESIAVQLDRFTCVRDDGGGVVRSVGEPGSFRSLDAFRSRAGARSCKFDDR